LIVNGESNSDRITEEIAVAINTITSVASTLESVTERIVSEISSNYRPHKAISIENYDKNKMTTTEFHSSTTTGE
jgi:hypothetical protein